MEAAILNWLAEHGVSAVWGSIIVLIALRVADALIALARAQIERITSARWRQLALDIVQAVEQALATEAGTTKKAKAVAKLAARGVPEAEAGDLVESVVYELNSDKKLVQGLEAAL